MAIIERAFQRLFINEFAGLHLDHQKSYDVQMGEQALEQFSFGDCGVRDTVIAQSRVLLFWYCTTYLLLKKNDPKYHHLEPPLEQIQPNLQLACNLSFLTLTRKKPTRSLKLNCSNKLTLSRSLN